MEISSIDDLLSGAKSHTQPETPEHQYQSEPEPIEEMEQDTPDYGTDDEGEPEGDHTRTLEPEQDEDDAPKDEHTKEYDEYGNEKAKPRTYTQEEVNEMFRRRFKNKPEAEQQAVMQQVQQANQAGFEFNPDSELSLPQQLQSFIEKTVTEMSAKEKQRQQQLEEQTIQQEFEEKLVTGMQRFSDFKDVMTNLPCEITNPMTYATRAMADPAAFLYAAAKRHPQELERISRIRDPYAQVAEMGKLEERMRRNKPTTKAPRPLGRLTEDASTPAPKKKSEPSIEDLIAKSEARKMAQLKARRGR